MRTFQQRAATVIRNLEKVRTYQDAVKAAIKFVQKTLEDAEWLQQNHPEVYTLYITQREEKDLHTMRLCSTRRAYTK
jgi:hydroxymethylpyrimidine/phosphomethylpyrimidine kinase